jgi:hypothetical protein
MTCFVNLLPKIDVGNCSDFPTYLSFKEKINTAVEWLGRYWSRIKNFQNNRLASQTSILLLNISILTTKIFCSIPKVFATVPLTLLNFVGLLNIKDMHAEVKKLYIDAVSTFKLRILPRFILTVLKVAVEVTDFFLVISMSAVAVIGLTGNSRLTSQCYKYAAPIALASFALRFAIQVVEWYLSQRLWSDLNNVPEAERSQIALDFRELVLQDGNTHQNHHPLSQKIFWLMDNYDLNAYRTRFLNMPTEDANTLYPNLVNIINYKRLDQIGSWGMLAFGYGSMAICKAYPNTLLQSSLTTVNAALYWVKEVKNYVQRWRVSHNIDIAICLYVQRWLVSHNIDNVLRLYVQRWRANHNIDMVDV